MTPKTPQQNTQLTVEDLVAKYTDYIECDEWHIHDGTGEHEGETPYLDHKDFDDELFKSQLLSLVMEVVGMGEFPNPDRGFKFYTTRNELRAEQRLKAQQLFNPKKGTS